MATFRIEKTKNYTVMSNYHLRDKSLSLKSKGLLSLMLSLPDDWDYTTKGLARICKDGVDSICAGVRELEEHGYIVRERVRNANGQLGSIEYTIYEQPKTGQDDAEPESPERAIPKQEKPERENPVQANPILDFPVLGKPEQENPAQLNTNKVTTNQLNTKQQNTDLSNTPSFLPSSYDRRTVNRPTDRRTDGKDMRERIREQIDYDILCERYDRTQLDELVEIMLGVALNRSDTISMGRDASYPTEYVKQSFSKLTAEHIEKVIDGLNENTTRVRNTRAYLTAALFNSISTMDHHYAMLVRHDEQQR